MAIFADDLTAKIFKAVADAVDRNGGSFAGTLPDGRTMTVLVLHEDAQPVSEGM